MTLWEARLLRDPPRADHSGKGQARKTPSPDTRKLVCHSMDKSSGVFKKRPLETENCLSEWVEGLNLYCMHGLGFIHQEKKTDPELVIIPDHLVKQMLNGCRETLFQLRR